MSRPKGYADWNPRPETLAVLAQVQSILTDYRDYLPLTARQIFYRMVGAYNYDKTEQAYSRLCEYLVRARRAQMIDFADIRDDGTVVLKDSGFDGPEQWWDPGLPNAAEAYKRDRAEGQDRALEVWCEAAGMAPQLARVARVYGVPVYSTGGFSSVTVTREIAQRAARRDVDTVFLHVGDYDPSGESIYEAMTADAHAFFAQARHWEGEGKESLDFRYHRVALTEDQVESYNLPTAPPKRSDTRSATWIGETCQAEAMAPDDLSMLVTHAIEAEYDMEVYRGVVEEEGTEREELVAEVKQMLEDRR